MCVHTRKTYTRPLRHKIHTFTRIKGCLTCVPRYCRVMSPPASLDRHCRTLGVLLMVTGSRAEARFHSPLTSTVTPSTSTCQGGQRVISLRHSTYYSDTRHFASHVERLQFDMLEETVCSLTAGGAAMLNHLGK